MNSPLRSIPASIPFSIAYAAMNRLIKRRA